MIKSNFMLIIKTTYSSGALVEHYRIIKSIQYMPTVCIASDVCVHEPTSSKFKINVQFFSQSVSKLFSVSVHVSMAQSK